MEKRLVPWIKGIAAAVAAMLIYAVPLGLMTALVLLVAAMEEGSNVLSAQTVPLSKAVILLSEGVGFQGGSIVMGVTPLLLTILLIALIRTVCTKTSTDPRAFVSGAVVWLLLQHVLMSGLHVRLEDSTGVVMGKALLIYTLGYLLAAVPHMPLLGVTKNYIRRYVSAPVRHSIRVGVRTALILLAGVALVGLGTVIVWITLGHHQMSAWFDALHMQTGSRVLMCVIGLAWLPNVCLWAISWLFGAGFSIGEAANYTLWSSTTQDLPPLPLFALFPQAIDHDALRTAVMLIPLGLGIAVGLSMLFARSGFHIRLKQDSLDMRSLLMDFAYPAGAFCISAAVLSIVNAIVFPGIAPPRPCGRGRAPGHQRGGASMLHRSVHRVGRGARHHRRRVHRTLGYGTARGRFPFLLSQAPWRGPSTREAGVHPSRGELNTTEGEAR